MNRILQNIQFFMMLILLMAGMQSCSDKMQDMGDAQVSFTASLPAHVRTRSFGKAEQVNTLIIGIFKDGIEIDRKSYVVSGTSVDVQLALAKNQAYSFIFWAYDNRQNIYNIDDLTSIKMTAMPEQIEFSQAEAMDAFFAVAEDITPTGSCSYSVELLRPLAQINVGTTGIPVLAAFVAKSVPDTFHPFDNSVSGTCDFIWSFKETTTETFTVENIDYNYLAMGYLFAPTEEPMDMDAEMTMFYSGQSSRTVEFSKVKIEANQRSNIAGGFTAKQE